jgi:hypothetical protein
VVKLSEVARLIELALDRKPPKVIADICVDIDGDWYFPYYHLMFLLATHIKWGKAVELGVEKGRGVMSMAAGCPDYQVIGLDNNLQKSSFANAKLYELPSLPVPAFIKEHGCHIALLHIDTEHSYAMAKAEFEAYEPYLQPGAVVLFDDLHAHDNDVLRFFSELPYPKIQDDRLHPVNGYGVMLYAQKIDRV